MANANCLKVKDLDRFLGSNVKFFGRGARLWHCQSLNSYQLLSGDSRDAKVLLHLANQFLKASRLLLLHILAKVIVLTKA